LKSNNDHVKQGGQRSVTYQVPGRSQHPQDEFSLRTTHGKLTREEGVLKSKFAFSLHWKLNG
jgi:hypothetical protein